MAAGEAEQRHRASACARRAECGIDQRSDQMRVVPRDGEMRQLDLFKRLARRGQAR
jgi:hypothetical protein